MIGNRRKEMGEEAWIEYQKQRKIDKAKAWRSRNSERVVDCRRRNKERLIEYKGGQCERCGFKKDCPSCFHFHHKDPNEKSFGIGENGATRSLKLLKLEADKCELLCSNCHAEVHELLFRQQREETKKRHSDWMSKKKNIPL